MSQSSIRHRVFSLNSTHRVQSHPVVIGLTERALGLSELEREYRALTNDGDPASFAASVLRKFDVQVACTPSNLERIPREGPLVVVANHPSGALDGIVLLSLLAQRRPDLKILANRFLEAIPEMQPVLIPVEVLERSGGAAQNSGAARAALRHLRNEGALLVFPAGEVAHRSLQSPAVQESPWQAGLGKLIQLAAAPVIPVHLSGSNSLTFQLAGMLHPRLRTALLPRELLNKRGQTVEVRVGGLVASRRTREQPPEEVIAWLQRRTEQLAQRATFPEFASRRGARIADPLPSEQLAAEIEGLPSEAWLVESGAYRVFLSRSERLPSTLLELGRLRQLAFRAVGEGTAAERDLDEYDARYEHLVLYHRGRREIAGAYRLGRIQPLLAEAGPRGLYVSTGFALPQAFAGALGNALELGRSFVSPEYQRSSSALALLWRGIGRLLDREPTYRYLLGPCSISAAYQPLSQRVMLTYLRNHHGARRAGVRPHHPVMASSREWQEAEKIASEFRSLDELSNWVAHFEGDAKPIPTLLRQYLALNADILAFNADRDFNCIDALVLVDVTRIPQRKLEVFMGEDGAARYLAHSQHPARPPVAA
jgi:putative hemolysin